MLSYLSQSGRFHPKHGGGGNSSVGRGMNKVLPPLHPMLAFIIHYSIAISSTFYVHDTFFNTTSSTQDGKATIERQSYISKFLFIYTLILFTTRYISSYYAGKLRHYSVLYEFTWLCNFTLVVGCITFCGGTSWFFRRRPLVATACCIAISIDQVMWYVDSVGFILTRQWLIGVMKYLTWKQTLWIDRVTCLHHLWTIPIILYGANTSLTWDSVKVSALIVIINVLLSRWLTPHCIQSGATDDINKKNPLHYRYLNVNLAHELWQDITLPFLQISKDKPGCVVYLFRLLWRWIFLNTLIYIAILYPLNEWIIS